MVNQHLLNMVSVTISQPFNRVYYCSPTFFIKFLQTTKLTVKIVLGVVQIATTVYKADICNDNIYGNNNAKKQLDHWLKEEK